MASYTMIQQIILPEETPQLQNPVMTHQELPSPTTLTGGCQIVNAFEKEERIEMENQEKTPTPEMIVCSGENPWKSQGGKLSRNYWQTLQNQRQKTIHTDYTASQKTIPIMPPKKRNMPCLYLGYLACCGPFVFWFVVWCFCLQCRQLLSNLTIHYNSLT